MYDNRKWVILNVSDVTDEMVDNSIQTSLDTLRKSVNDSQCILKWDGDTPSCFDGMTTYNHSQILETLKGEDWKNGLG